MFPTAEVACNHTLLNFDCVDVNHCYVIRFADALLGGLTEVTMSGRAWVQLAIEKIGCSQKELAIRLGVSPAQISKWKNDEHMSFEMEGNFRALTGIESMDPDFVIWAHSLDNAKIWERLIVAIADLAFEGAETGYDTLPLQDEPERLCWNTFHTLREMGVVIPQQIPSEFCYIVSDEATEDDFEKLLNNPYADLIFKIYKSLNDVYGFYAAYISHLIDDENLDIMETGMEIESCLMSIAAVKIEIDTKFAPSFSDFKYETMRDYKKWLSEVKNAAFRSGVPLKAELLDLVNNDHDSLGHEAEAESFGFNGGRLHPDVYMNELLVGMRTVHQVLPAILQKLKIDDKDFRLDMSNLRLG